MSSGVVVAEVGDADDLAAEAALPAGHGGGEAGLQRLDDRGGLDPVRGQKRGQGVARVSRGATSGSPRAAAAARVMAARMAAFATSASTPPMSSTA